MAAQRRNRRASKPWLASITRLPDSRLENSTRGTWPPASAPISSTRSCVRFWTSNADRLGARCAKADG
jgi:hypothetical protein